MKTVLVSYCPVTNSERNKIIQIPEECREGDITYLKRKCREFFAFGNNVSLEMIFQRFDSDWECYIDLEEDSVVFHKEKLKLVVTPSLNDCTASSLCQDELSISVCIFV